MNSQVERLLPPPLISVIMPAHNEEAALPQTIKSLAVVLNGFSYEIIIVDDGSSDKTWKVIQELGLHVSGIRGLRFTRNFGHQAAILAGLQASQGEAIITMDSDGQHPPELLRTFIECWREGNLVVQGVRLKGADEGVFKRWSSRLFYQAFSALSGMHVPIGAADFRLMGRPVVNTLLLSTGPMLLLRGLIPWLGYQTCYVSFEAERRVAGRPSYTFQRMLRLSIDGLLSFSIIPLRIAIALGFFVSILSFSYLIYVVVVRLASNSAVPGWASMAGMLSLLGGIQLLTIGILGEYLGRLFISNLNRPHFVIREQI